MSLIAILCDVFFLRSEKKDRVAAWKGTLEAGRCFRRSPRRRFFFPIEEPAPTLSLSKLFSLCSVLLSLSSVEHADKRILV